ncbi:MAG: NAD-dependent epimerase/dehydratase family protein [Phycisphaerae bacterium]
MSSPSDKAHRPFRALVTGGGGFLGRAIVERLRARGDQVRSFARGDYPELAQLDVEVLRGDVADANAVSTACRGCDVVFHVAARAGVWGKYEEYYRPNVRGTENVIAACRANGVSRLVYTSSASVVFAGGDLENADESTPYPARHHSHYSATKAIAEQSVLAANDDHLRTLALRPHLIWGPRDNHIVPRLVARARAGQLRRIGPGHNKVDSTYIDNAVDAHLLAADALGTNSNAAGRAYFITNGEPRPVWELINGILAAAGAPPVRRKLSWRTARTIGGVLEFVHTVFRVESEPRMTRFIADELATSHWFDISAARKELGYKPRVSIDEGLQRLEQWFHETGGADQSHKRERGVFRRKHPTIGPARSRSGL